VPDDKILLPGVIESCSNYVEHSGVVTDRIERLANVVGRERVMASTDCGFASLAKLAPVMPDVISTKHRSLAERAAIASGWLWGSGRSVASV
jgi:5-methyltetrahydropteroyltriglutamate--homocysteine methyltransferase